MGRGGDDAAANHDGKKASHLHTHQMHIYHISHLHTPPLLNASQVRIRCTVPMAASARQHDTLPSSKPAQMTLGGKGRMGVI